MSTRSKERSRTDFPADAGPERDVSLGGEGELSGVSIDCIAPVSEEYVLVQVCIIGTRRTPLRYIYTRLEGYDTVSSKQLCAALLRETCHSHSLTGEHLPSVLVLAPIAAGSVRCPRRFVRWSPSVRSEKWLEFVVHGNQPLRSHTSCAPVLVCQLVGA